LHNKTQVSLVLFCLIFAALCPTSIGSTVAVEPLDVGWVSLEISKDDVQQHVKFLSSLESRVTGYDGFFAAAEYIVQKFREYRVKPYSKDGGYYEYYNMSVPIDLGTFITIPNGSELNAYKLWPSYNVNPSPYVSPEQGDILVYVGKGLDKDFVGKSVEGKFVLMDFDSRWYFKRAIDYGARGVIFVGPADLGIVIRTEVEQKLAELPLPIPMLYLPYDKGKILIDLCRQHEEIRIHVNTNMSWQNVRVPNVVGIVEGNGSQSHEQIVVSAYYDSWSIVPKLSPGASEALGISVLLDLARFLSENRPSRSVVLVALSGHNQALGGAREFVDRHFDEIGSEIKAFIGMDLSSDTDQLGIFSVGSSYTFFNSQNFNLKYGILANRFFVTYLSQMKRVLGLDYGETFVDGITNSHPVYIMNSPSYDLSARSSKMFDSDPFTVACFGSGFTYHTVNAFRTYFRTMADTYDRISFTNLWPQAQFIFSTIWGLANEPTWLAGLFMSPTRLQSDWGYTTLKVKVSTYNVTTNYYDPFDAFRHPEESKQVIIKVRSISTALESASLQASGVMPLTQVTGTEGMLDITVLADAKGEAVITGLKPFSMNIIDAFAINLTNGHIEWATDLGVYSYEGGRVVKISSAVEVRPISVFRSGAIAMFNLINPTELNSLIATSVNNHLSHGIMLRQSVLQTGSDFMFFVEPNTPAEILFSVGRGYPGGVLINTTLDNSEGSGYTVAPGECLVLTFSSVRIAEDISAINNQRSERLITLNTINPQIKIYRDLALLYINQTSVDIAYKRLDRLCGDSYAAWAFGMLSYHYIMDQISSVIFSIVIFFVILIPFSLFLERLLGDRKGLERILMIVAIFMIALGVLVLFHPGFQLATNTSMVFISVGMVILTVLVMGTVSLESVGTARALRKDVSKHHFAEISRESAVSQAFSLGVQYMKKRSFRSLLTLLSLTFIASALITFTSISLAPSPLRESISGEAVYQGMLLRKYPWSSIPEYFYHQLESQLYEADVVPRGWLYPPPPLAGAESQIFFGSKQIASISAILALSPKEKEVTAIDRILLPGSRWFIDEDLFACIINKRLAGALESEWGRPIEVGSTVPLWGINLTVVGIFDGNFLWSGAGGIRDLDQEPITPAQRQAAGAMTAEPPHYNGLVVMIIPYRLFEMLHADTADPISMVVKFPSPDYLQDLTNQLVLRLPLRIYYSYEDRIVLTRPFQWFSAIGTANILIPLLIASLTMLNMMIGQIYERIRDIKVFNSVGLSPLHIMGMYLAESSVYGALSGVFGYELGIAGAYMFTRLGLYPPEFYLNYSSGFVLAVVGIALGVSVLSTLYPAYFASKVEIPSLERKWTIPSPKGDQWEIILPFIATPNETLCVLAFVKEYLETHATEQTGLFVTEKVNFYRKEENGKDVRVLKSTLHIAPYDMGIYQDFSIQAFSTDRERYSIVLTIERRSGLQDIWIKSNRVFIDTIRKQILIWRALTPSQKEEYYERGLELEKVRKAYE